jgi:hypothetical protein
MISRSVTPTNPLPTSNLVLPALHLGWLAVEAFGLLRWFALSGKPPSPDKIDATRRFNFSKRAPTQYQQLLVALQMLKATSAEIVPGLPPPIPDDLSAYLQAAKDDINPLWKQFEEWSSQTWNTLQISDPQAGQAFTCGGDLADTFWYAQGAGAGKLAEMLRSYRLEYIAERVDDLAACLPEHSALAIRHSLERWSIVEDIDVQDEKRNDRLLKRLESQIKVWRDLLFGLRQAGSYLTPPDRRQIAFWSIAGTAGLVIGIGLVTWLLVLLLAGVGRSLMGSAMHLPVDTSKITSDVTAYLSNWQNGSALLATLSSILAVLTGVIKGLSGWLWAFHQNCWQALTLRAIQKRTYRDFNYTQEEKSLLTE